MKHPNSRFRAHLNFCKNKSPILPKTRRWIEVKKANCCGYVTLNFRSRLRALRFGMKICNIICQHRSRRNQIHGYTYVGPISTSRQCIRKTATRCKLFTRRLRAAISDLWPGPSRALDRSKQSLALDIPPQQDLSATIQSSRSSRLSP